MRIIDFHTHVVPPWVIEEREELSIRDACFGMLYSHPSSKLATAEELLHSMDEAEVSMSIALNIGWMSHEMCVRTNDYLIESAIKWPERIIPFCMVQPTDVDHALRELERCAAGGARGIGELRPDIQNYSLADTDLLAPLIDVATNHGMVLLTHVSEPVGHEYPGKGRITPDQPYALAKAFPQVSLVCAHWGGGLPIYCLMPEVRKTLSNVYFDTAATQYLYSPEVFRVVSQLAGVEHVVFGSDFPLISQQRALNDLRSAALSEEAQLEVLWASAHRMLANPGGTHHG